MLQDPLFFWDWKEKILSITVFEWVLLAFFPFSSTLFVFQLSDGHFKVKKNVFFFFSNRIHD